MFNTHNISEDQFNYYLKLKYHIVVNSSRKYLHFCKGVLNNYYCSEVDSGFIEEKMLSNVDTLGKTWTCRNLI